MTEGGGTGRLELDPASATARRQAIQQGGKLRRGFEMNFLLQRRFEFNHGVIEFLAIGAQDGLDGDVPAAIRAAGHPRAITAFGTFEEIRAAHKPFAESSPDAAVCWLAESQLGARWVKLVSARLRSSSFDAAVFALRSGSERRVIKVFSLQKHGLTLISSIVQI